jgi:hypothetical protein
MIRRPIRFCLFRRRGELGGDDAAALPAKDGNVRKLLDYFLLLY